MEEKAEAIECPVCFDTLDLDKVVYYTIDGKEWIQHKYCLSCLEDLRAGAWDMYISNLKKADCEKSLKRCLKSGIPDKLTVDASLTSPMMLELKFDNNIIPTRLNITISEEQLRNLNIELNKIYDSMHESDVFDYIGEIHILLQKYSL